MRVLACIAGGFAAAIFLFVYALSVRAGLFLAALCLIAGVAACCLRRDWAKRAAVILLSFAVGLGWSGAYWHFFLAPLDALDGKTIPISVTATGYAVQTPYGFSVPVSFETDGRAYKAVLYYNDTAPIAPGDTLRASARLRMTGDRPGEEASYHGAKGESLTLSVRGAVAISPAGRLRLRNLPAAFSQKLLRSLARVFCKDAEAFTKALVAGERSGLSFALSNDLSVAGLYHAVAISGMHISILLGMILLVLGSRRRLAALIGLPIIWFYAFAVGAGAPVIRAAIMQSFLLLAPLCRRENDTPTALFTALALILLPNPRAAANVALQMSFASIAGILLFSGRCFAYIWNLPRIQKLRKKSPILAGVFKTALAVFSTALAVMPMTLPLSAVYFGIFSVIAPLSSVLVLPVISLCFSWGLLAGLAGLFSTTLGTVLAWPVHALVRYCTGMAHKLAQIPFAAVYTSGAYMTIFLVYLYLIILFFSVSKRKCSLLTAGACTAGMLCLCLLLGSLEFDRAQMTVHMLDVGQGQCVYLESGGVSAFYDCGGSGEQTGEIAARYLAAAGRATLDALVISHYDADHAKGAAHLLSRVRVGTVYLPPAADEKGIRAEIVAAATQSGTKVVFVTDDLRLRFGNGALFLYAPVSENSNNDGSVAALLRVADFDALMTGDMSYVAEQQLLLSHSLPDIELLVAGHHGAKSSTSAALLRTLRPETALISVGAHNSYGHPSDETLVRLQKAGVQYYRTDQCGNVTIRR